MKKRSSLIIFMPFLILALVFSVAIILLNQSRDLKNFPQEITRSQVTPTPSIHTSQSEVTITKSGFIPVTLTVKRGDQVKWLNTDSSLHQIASEPNQKNPRLSGFDSVVSFPKDEAFVYTFEQRGTFPYYDPLNSKLKGTIIVN